jgi:hypothetical protein
VTGWFVPSSGGWPPPHTREDLSPGQIDEVIDRALVSAWALLPDTSEHRPVVQRARWVLAEQPGRQVSAVRTTRGLVWPRVLGVGGEAFDCWQDPEDPSITLSWPQLLVECGPLDDATPGS